MTTRPTVAIPLWCTTNDPYNAPGEAWDGLTRIVDPGALVEEGHEPETEPGAQEWNYHERAQGEWLDFLAFRGFNYWHDRVAIGATVIKWDSTKHLWLAAGVVDDSFDFARAPHTWTADDNDSTTGFLITELVVNCTGDLTNNVLAMSYNDAGLRVWDGSAWSTEALGEADDRIGAAIWYEAADKIVAIGWADADTGLANGIVLLTSANHDDLTVWDRDEFDTPLVLLSPPLAAIATNGNTRICAAISTATQINVYTSNDGTTWTQFADVTGAIEAELADLAYDAINGQWLMLTAIDGIWIATPGSEPATWTQLCADPFDLVNVPGISSGSKNIYVLGRQIIVTSSTGNHLAFSSDNGVTWEFFSLGYSGAVLDIAYSPERNQFLVLDATGVQWCAS